MIMSKLTESVIEALQEDIVSYWELQQLAGDISGRVTDFDGQKAALRELLNAGVRVGEAFNEGGSYVRFVAWRGDIDERIERMERTLKSVPKQDQGFAVWFCLEEKVDEYE